LQETQAMITSFRQIRLLADANIPSIVNTLRVLHGRHHTASELRGLAARSVAAAQALRLLALATLQEGV
jgi:hypothetical protein